MKILITAVIIILAFGGCATLKVDAEGLAHVNNERQLRTALERGAANIVLNGNIMLVDGASYDFTGVTFIFDNGKLIVPSGAEVTVTGSEGWGAAAVSRYLRGEDETAWLHRPDFVPAPTEANPNPVANPDIQRRFWDQFAPNPHWCPPFAHGVTAISVRNEGQLRAALASTAASRDRVILLNDIYLTAGVTYDFSGLRLITEPGEFSIGSPLVIYRSGGGRLIIPAGAVVLNLE